MVIDQIWLIQVENNIVILKRHKNVKVVLKLILKSKNSEHNEIDTVHIFNISILFLN